MNKNVWIVAVLSSTLASNLYSQNVTQLPEDHHTLAQVIEEVSGSVALITTEEQLGSGFYVTTNGWVITALHVVRLKDKSTAKKILVESTMPAAKVGSNTIMGATIAFTATVVAEDEDHDLALLSVRGDPFKRGVISYDGVDPSKSRHYAVMCPRTLSLKSGDPIFTIGHPLGDLREVATAGIVASSEPTGFDRSGAFRGTYLVDMLINHGNSGGPVFARTGCVIGVADAITLRAIEAVGRDNQTIDKVPSLPVNGQDGTPLIGQDGQPIMIRLEYSTGLGSLIPQQYVIKLLDSAGLEVLHPDAPAPPPTAPPK